jgi:hypothetical protein
MVVPFAWIKPPSVAEVEAAAAEDSVEAVEDTVADVAAAEVDTAEVEEDMVSQPFSSPREAVHADVAQGEAEAMTKVDAPVVEVWHLDDLSDTC